MLKKIYYCETNGYDFVISAATDDPDWVLYSLEALNYAPHFDPENKAAEAMAWIKTIEDDSSWSNAEDEGLTLADLLDGVDVLAEAEIDL